jgi:hypothetical protein
MISTLFFSFVFIVFHAPATMTPTAPSHDQWHTLLQKHVNSTGKVDYKGFQKDRAALDAYLKLLSDNPPQNNWSRDEKMAYWINAYNAFTIDLIADHYPLKSIMDLDGGKTWDVPRITLGGKKYSLNQIENDILRPQFQDARIHFVINCAARSCPPLWNQAFTAKNLSSALDQRTRTFINDPQYNTLKGKTPAVSKIFEWYAADFGDLRTFLNRYGKVKIPEGAKIGFQEYDWGVNG